MIQLLLTILMTLILTLPAFATGGADGVGGDILQSSKSQVRTAVNLAMKMHLTNFFYSLAFARDQVKDPYVFRVLTAFYDRPLKGESWEARQPILKDIATTPYIFNEDGGCVGGMHERNHAASVSEYKLGAPICFSVPLLRVSAPGDLQAQVVALAAHEFAHHFGFGEYEATLLQTFVLHNAKILTEFPNQFVVNFKEIKPLTVLFNFGGQGVAFKAGEMLPKPPSTGDSVEPICSMQIEFDFKEGDEVRTSGKFPPLYLLARAIELKSYNMSGGIGLGMKPGLSEVNFYVNPALGEGSWYSTGAKLYRTDGKETTARLSGIYCQGQGLQLMDLKRVFGEYIDISNVLK